MISNIFKKLPEEIKCYIVSFLVGRCYICKDYYLYFDKDLSKCYKCKKKICEYHKIPKLNTQMCSECLNNDYHEAIDHINNLMNSCNIS